MKKGIADGTYLPKRNKRDIMSNKKVDDVFGKLLEKLRTTFPDLCFDNANIIDYDAKENYYPKWKVKNISIPDTKITDIIIYGIEDPVICLGQSKIDFKRNMSMYRKSQMNDTNNFTYSPYLPPVFGNLYGKEILKFSEYNFTIRNKNDRNGKK